MHGALTLPNRAKNEMTSAHSLTLSKDCKHFSTAATYLRYFESWRLSNKRGISRESIKTHLQERHSYLRECRSPLSEESLF